ncbi:MAG: proton-conducting transporter membrane subunit [Myxococcales bacterium]
MALLLSSLAVLAATAVLAGAFSRSPRWATGIAAAGVVVAALLGLWPAIAALSGPETVIRVAWTAPYGDVVLGLDRLSAFFLIPLLVLAAATAVYGRAYLLGGKRRPLGPPALFFNLVVASLLLVLLARDAILFLVAWEASGVTSFLVIGFQHDEPEVRRASWVYLAAMQIGAAFVIAFLLLLMRQAGGTDFAAFLRMQPPAPWFAAALAALGIAGCGVKAGIVPMHVWLPEAHAAAPSHMSALLSGGSINIGLYGLLRALSFLPPARWWGPAFLVIGFAGAAFGISQALLQRDLKRALAYSSVENMGLILVGIGIAFWGTAMGSPLVAALGALAAGFHLWSHALMKGLLFLCAGSVLHGTGTRDLEALGGLARRMPWTSALLLFGAVAIAALPPLNGFVAEWLLIRGLFTGALARGGAPSVAAMLAVGGLALVGSLAALCFVRLAGIALLGNPRSDAAARAHESPKGLLVPMLLLAAGCGLLSVRPGIAIAPARAFAGHLFGEEAGAQVQALAPSLGTLGLVSAGIAAVLAIVAVALTLRVRASASRPTWDCGYAAPTARMQYTASSFAQIATGELLPGALTPRTIDERPRGLFPHGGAFRTEVADPLTRSWYEPFFTRWADRFTGLRWLQQGVLHAYLLYILAVVVAALGWASLRGWALQ